MAVLHGALQLALGSVVLLEVDLLEVLDGRGMEVVELRPQGRCGGKQKIRINQRFPLTVDSVCDFDSQKLLLIWTTVSRASRAVTHFTRILDKVAHPQKSNSQNALLKESND